LYEEKCAFVMPTYNTYQIFRDQKIKGKLRKCIGEVIRPIGPVLDDLISEIKNSLKGDHEVIIVNDGCTDETKIKIIELLKLRKFKKVANDGYSEVFSISHNGLNLSITILNLETNQGLTPAVVLGYCEALKREPVFVVKLDSTGDHDPSNFPCLLGRITKGKKMKIVVSRCDLLGFGFRLIRSEILAEIMPDLEKYSDSLFEKYPDNPECRRKVDRMTNQLIGALNKCAC